MRRFYVLFFGFAFLLFLSCNKAAEIIEANQSDGQVVPLEINSFSSNLGILLDNISLPIASTPMDIKLMVVSSYNLSNGTVLDTSYYELGEFIDVVSIDQTITIEETEAIAKQYHAQLIYQKDNIIFYGDSTSWQGLNGIEPFDNLSSLSNYYTQTQYSSFNSAALMDYSTNNYALGISDFPYVIGEEWQCDIRDWTITPRLIFPDHVQNGGTEKIVAENQFYSLMQINYTDYDDTIFVYYKQNDELKIKGNNAIKMFHQGNCCEKSKGVAVGDNIYFESVMDPPSGSNDRRILKYNCITESVSTVKTYSSTDSSLNWVKFDAHYDLFSVHAYGKAFTLQQTSNSNNISSLFVFNESSLEWDEQPINMAIEGSHVLAVVENELYIQDCTYSIEDGYNNMVYKINPDYSLEEVGRIGVALSGLLRFSYVDQNGDSQTSVKMGKLNFK